MNEGLYHIRIFYKPKQNIWGEAIGHVIEGKQEIENLRNANMWLRVPLHSLSWLRFSFSLKYTMLSNSPLVLHPNGSIIVPLYEETTNLENTGFPGCSLATLLFGLTNISGNGIAWVLGLVCSEFVCFFQTPSCWHIHWIKITCVTS